MTKDLEIINSKLAYAIQRLDYLTELVGEIYNTGYNKFNPLDKNIYSYDDEEDEIPELTQSQMEDILDLLWRSEKYGVNENGTVKDK
ncbi:hypothetical protein JJB27_08300 [Campylobacter fetus subsp. venerealis]|uniref:hypothetical protein n=1 Tax=Campylobacter TaxID=194 RepID=UPI00080B1D01|nr:MULTISPECIES: hypothetical protein [Campylobacter]OCS21607.1 hypothetical protein CFVI97532_08830 [Campylobacter fetus subsp. venerealis cfvi97/532]KAA3685284.1 hypothetical protein E3U42_09415 [Campylobacter fetus subsp. fetus]KAA3686025.1 hypothetical protein E3U40_02430 [Campylobacter fetus subsp. venerealis]MBK3499065.1 hypothetical protein [Campylobacter fetus subsp. venerealis]MBK3503024.1 hypothetical protein [Campylobacter fetus subsp. venerealis]